ncbi:hypothetical protein BCR33DRAFT_855158 [Rhizoclosmatium globosum]|uniref:Uncharacterized protein n=1 Tax=Rhizoclosmatium globosum TaxID=329046 RepID=A0A1Y2BPP5_9FUNG|nr:hypothetical protein BCR33DRAFT_855158 [Rhizoclosmatium globosum]|eukprot:ORY36728.1 hypothetical protein BCR33DRAFT_855158 [Rhizoclosmatium globosum]
MTFDPPTYEEAHIRGLFRNNDIEILTNTADLDKAKNASNESVLASELSANQIDMTHLKRTLSQLRKSRTHLQNVILNYDFRHSKMIEEQKQLANAFVELHKLREEIKSLLDITFIADNDKAVIECGEHIFSRDSNNLEIVLQFQNQLDEAETKRNLFKETKPLLMAANAHLHTALNSWETTYLSCFANDKTKIQNDSTRAVEEVAKAIALITDAKKIDISSPSWAALGLQHFEVLDMENHSNESAREYCDEAKITLNFARRLLKARIERLSNSVIITESLCAKVSAEKSMAIRNLYTFRINVMEQACNEFEIREAEVSVGGVDVLTLLLDFILE